MNRNKFDILFLCHKKDKEILKKSLEYAKKNIIGYRKIFILSQKNFFKEDKDIVFVNEKIFPFTKKEIAEYAPKERKSGWYYQQFLKLYFFKVMGDKVLDNLLIIDADVIFIKKTSFFENGIPLYNFETGYHEPYYHLMKKLFGFGRQNLKFSGITHHMVFQRKYINEILSLKIKNTKEIFWKGVMKNIDLKTESSFSEWELYFNYMLIKHPSKIKIRKMRFADFPYNGKIWRTIFILLGYNYIASHEYFKNQKFPTIRSLTLIIITRSNLKPTLKKIFVKLGLFKIR